jgi:acyl carrier protein
MKPIESRAEKVFKKVFETENITALNKKVSPEWDSLKHIELVLELEDEFAIEFTNSASSEIYDFNSCIKTLLETL